MLYFLLMILGILVVVLFLPPFVMYGLLGVGNMLGYALGAVLFLLGFFGWKRKRAGKNPAGTGWRRVLRRVVSAIVIVCLLLAAVETGFIVRGAGSAPAGNATAVVLGCRVNGSTPSLTLRERIMAAYHYLSENPEAYCVATGGKDGFETISEAACIRNELVRMGIEEERIFLDETSANTRQNLANAAAIIREEGLPADIAIVTSEYHEYRAGRIASRLGLPHGSVPSASRPWLLPMYMMREYCSILYDWVKYR